MTHLTPRVLVVSVSLIALGAALVGSASSSAGTAQKATEFDMHTTAFCDPYPACSQDGVKAKAVYKGDPFGKCKAKGELIIPKLVMNWKCDGGGFTVVSKASTGGAEESRGKWRIKDGSGSGDYSGISGNGKFKGTVSTGKYRLRGEVDY